MAFFNKVQQKTREFADSTKLSSTISEEEKKINRIYTEIGKRYYAAHSLDEVPEFPEQMAAISASRKRIKDCQDQLQKLKSVVRCNVCGAEVPGSSAFCPSCGSPMNAAPAPAYVGNCSRCGGPLLSGAKFCTRCGTPVSIAPAAPVTPAYQPEPAAYQPPAYQPEPAAYEPPAYQPEPAAYEPPAYQPEPAAYEPPAYQPEPVYEAPAPAEQASRCPQCGAELEPDSVFCTNCGTRVQD